MTETVEPKTSAPAPIVNESGLALAVYILYLAGFVTGVTAFVGVIIAHVKASSSSDWLETHFRFQIRTFWIGLAYSVLGWFLFALVIGVPILLWWFTWTLVRVIKGMLLLNERKPIAKPSSWLFG